MAASFDDGNPEIPDGVVGAGGARPRGRRRHRRAHRRQRAGARRRGLRGPGGPRPDRRPAAHRGPGRDPGRPRRLLDAPPGRQPGPPVRRDIAGIERRPGDPLPTLTAFDCATGHWFSHADVEATLTAELDGYTAALDELRARLGPTASAAEGIEAYLATTGLAGDALRRARQGLRASVEADAAGAAEHQSLEWLWTQDEYDGNYFGDLPEGGYAAVAEAMAAGLDVRRGWPVARVDLTDGGVTVTSASGETESGSHVVVTVPLGALKNDLPSFAPPLPPERADAIHRLGFGRYEKVALAFDEPFWRQAGWSHLVLFPPDPAEPASWVFDLDAFGAGRSWCATRSTPPPVTCSGPRPTPPSAG